MAVPRTIDHPELRRLLVRAMVLPALLILGLAVILVWQILVLQRAAAGVDKSGMVIARAHALARMQREAEGSLRGYVLTGDRSFLDLYVSSGAALEPAYAELKRLVAGDPEQIKSVERLHASSNRWVELAAIAAEVGLPDRSAEPLVARAALLESMTTETAWLIEREQELREARLATARNLSRRIVISAIVCAVLLGSVVALLVRSQSHRVSAVYRRAALEVEERTKKLREGEERFRLFVEGVADAAIYMLDPEGRVQSWNAGATRIEGYEPGEVEGRHFSIFFTPEDVDAGLPDRTLAAASEGQVDSETWRVRKDGSRFWAKITMRALRDGDGQLVGYAKLVRNTTERKRAEMRRAARYGVSHALSESGSPEEALPRVLEALGTALGYGSAMAWRVVGEALFVVGIWERPSSPFKHFTDDLKRRSVERGEGTVGRAWETGLVQWVVDLRFAPGDPVTRLAMEAGLRSVLAFPVTVGHQVACVLQLMADDPREKDDDLVELASDLALEIGGNLERWSAQAALREAEHRRAEELERLVAERTAELVAVNHELEAFSYSVSHDLRAPLRGIEGFSRALLEEEADRLDEQGKDLLSRIRGASLRMSKLIDDIIRLSRATRAELKRESVDLSALVREVIDEVRENFPAHPMRVRVQDGVHVRGDPRLLRAGLANVIGNSFKFTRDSEDPILEFTAEDSSGERVYKLRDNGAGFDMAHVEKLFQPFQRLHTNAEFEGTGIGLATWQRIVRRHGGRVWAEGLPGAGATFSFTLGEF